MTSKRFPSLEQQLGVMTPKDPGYYQMRSQLTAQQNLSRNLADPDCNRCMIPFSQCVGQCKGNRPEIRPKGR